MPRADYTKFRYEKTRGAKSPNERSISFVSFLLTELPPESPSQLRRIGHVKKERIQHILFV